MNVSIIIYTVKVVVWYKPAVGTVLETNGERNTRCEFAMELGLSGACADCAPGDYCVYD